VIRFVEIPLGRGAACSCLRCTPQTDARFDSAESIGALVAEAASAWSDGPGPNVFFTGPEPFSHPELPDLVAGAAGSGVERIGLRTDAGALSIPGNAEGVLAAGVRHLQVVMLAGSAGKHDGLSGRVGLFEAASAGVSAFVAAAHASHENVAVMGFVPACAHNMSELPAAVAALARLGALAVEIAVSPEAGGVRGLSDWTSSAIDTGLVNGVWVYLTGAGTAGVSPSELRCVMPFKLVGRAS